MKHQSISIILALSLAAGMSVSAEQTQSNPDVNFASSEIPSGSLTPSLRGEVTAAIGRSLDWLASRQRENGSWSNEDFPALTALPLWAFALSQHPQKQTVMEKAVRYILSCVQPNGGIYREVAGRKGGGLSNYNTAICMTALHATGDRELTPVILNARKFIASSQHFGDDIYDGGFGYDRDTGRPYTDLLNTFYAVQAMNLTADVEDLRPKGEQRADIDWQRTVHFITKLQNPPESGDDNAGGFFYNPTDPKAGTATNADGAVFFRSYGSMTYAGMLALIYANVTRDDPRVRSALDWARRHWSLDENLGMGQEGLYFFYNVLTRALSAAHCDVITRVDGTRINWRVELAKKLLSLQKIDEASGQGYWQNDNGRYWENDPVLVTAYCLLALEIL